MRHLAGWRTPPVGRSLWSSLHPSGIGCSVEVAGECHCVMSRHMSVTIVVRGPTHMPQPGIRDGDFEECLGVAGHMCLHIYVRDDVNLAP